jgi:hypothetical protein
MFAIFGLIFLFRRPFFDLIATAYEGVTDVIVTLVGG